MELYWLMLGVLAVWRVTHMLYGEDGPWNIFLSLRRWVGTSFIGTLLDCFYCLSVWIAVPVGLLLGEGWIEKIFLWLAASAGAILLERSTTIQRITPPAFFVEEKEK